MYTHNMHDSGVHVPFFLSLEGNKRIFAMIVRHLYRVILSCLFGRVSKQSVCTNRTNMHGQFV